MHPVDERQLHLSIQTALSLHVREREHLQIRGELEKTVGELQHQTQLMETVFDRMRDPKAAAICDSGRILRRSANNSL